MLGLARNKIWYPGMGKDIEDLVKSCDTCAVYGNNPPRSLLHPWEEPEKPWQRLHMDFAELNGAMWLIVIDAKTTWPEAVMMQSTTTGKLLEVLRQLFSTHGLSEQIVADNGPQFASKEFRECCRDRAVVLTLTPPYHPNSNGEAERFVQTFKRGMYKGMRDGRKVVEGIAREMLFEYRVTPHPATKEAPAEMLMGRRIRTALDVVRSDSTEKQMDECR